MAVFRILLPGAALCAAFLAAPALAEDGKGAREQTGAQGQEEPAGSQPPPTAERASDRSAGPDPAFAKPVFDDSWVTIGIGAGIGPSYSGSDDYRLFPLPLIVGRVGGVGISPNGPGLTLDLLSKEPEQGPPRARKGPSLSFGPTFRLRNDRANPIRDDVVEQAGELDTAVEIGVNGALGFSGVLHARDRVSLSLQTRWDVAGAHDGMLIEPGVSYFTPLGRGASVQLSASASFVDDDFADYYYSVSPAQSAASGLAPFTADGGLISVGLTAIGTLDLDGNALNGGFSLYAIAGYSQLVGDAADTPYTAVRGSADQFIGGVGVGYTF